MTVGPFQLAALVRSELDRDFAFADVTGNLISPQENRQVRAVIRAREAGVFAGRAITEAFFEIGGLLPRATCFLSDGASLSEGTEVLEFYSSFTDALRFERTLLNFLTHLSGIATETAKYVAKTKPYGVRLLATRKFIPGLRDLQLLAVEAGGGRVHRRNLADGILIKENHQTFVPARDLIARAKTTRSPLHKVEIEVQSFEALKEVLPLSPDIVMLDNFTLHELATAIPFVRDHSSAEVEVSGGVTLESISKIAELRPDSISVGAITHSVKALNLSLDIEEVKS